MAVKVRIQEDTMISIADAIREKYNADDQYYPSEMAGKIETLPVASAASLINRTINGAVVDKNGVVSTINLYRFYECSELQEVDFPACTSIGNYAFYTCSALASVSFPVCTNIGNSAFQYCSALASVDFPACISIGNSAFRSCYALESMYFMGSSVPTLSGSNVFIDTPMYQSSYLGYFGSIYVPSSLADDYRQASNWSYFSERIVGI